MKYLMLIYGNEEKGASFPAEAWLEAIAKQDAFNKKYQDTGELPEPRPQPELGVALSAVTSAVRR